MALNLELLALAEQVAKNAGELLSDRPSKFELDQKSGALDFATQKDHQSEALIAGQILAQRPGDGLIGEEGANKKSDTGITWVIDPIDGTVNYLYDLPGWCISIAAKNGKEVIAGVVYSPTSNSLWKASKSDGAFLNNLPIKCNDPVALDRALLGTGFAYDIKNRRVQAKIIQDLLPKVRDLRRLGACAVDICHVASGSLDAFFEEGVNEWDYAAASLIAQEAGATFSVAKARDGSASSAVIVAGPFLHATLSAQLRGQ
ncbi:MAG: inositol monophosphatase [Actinobacteria bacterium]|nr:inositol monophosphatase [Actinomycetota bacterium]